MHHDEMVDSVTVAALKNAAWKKLVEPGSHRNDHEDGQTVASIREVEHKGGKIRIETTYRITVDDEPVLGHVIVGDNGNLPLNAGEFGPDTIHGVFYGPNHEEVGGVFRRDGVLGAFGGNKVIRPYAGRCPCQGSL